MAQQVQAQRSVFISGSRGVKQLGVEAKQSLEKIIELGLKVVVGDAPGVDTEVQKYLAARKYKLVAVYACSMYGMRFGHAAGRQLGWTKRIVKGGPTARDEAANQGRDYALAIWDGASRGTKANIDRCRKLGVKCKVILANVSESI